MSRMTPNLHVIGILDDGWPGLSDTARAALSAASLVIGAGRTLDLVRTMLPQAELRPMDGALSEVPGWARAAGSSRSTGAASRPGPRPRWH